MRKLILLLIALTLAMGIACGGGGDAESEITFESVTEPGEYAVGEATYDLVDTSRPTEAYGAYEGSNERRLITEVWYPAQGEEREAALDSSGGPYPLIVFSHGFAGTRTQSEVYTRHLASHGYVVVSTDFPTTNGGAPDGPYFLGVLSQPGDVSFLIDTFLAFNDEPGHPLEGGIDAAAIGATGHSMGAFTTELAVWGTMRDERIGAAVPISGTGCFLDVDDVGDTSVPIMLLTGSNDLIVPAPASRFAYDIANAPRYWVEIAGANHIRFADIDLDDEVGVRALRSVGVGSTDAEQEVLEQVETDAPLCERPGTSEDPPLSLNRQQELLRAFATPFFDGYLSGDEDALAFLQESLPAQVAELRFEFDLE